MLKSRGYYPPPVFDDWNFESESKYFSRLMWSLSCKSELLMSISVVKMFLHPPIHPWSVYEKIFHSAQCRIYVNIGSFFLNFEKTDMEFNTMNFYVKCSRYVKNICPWFVKIWFLCNFPIKTTKSSFSMIVQFKPISYQRFHKKAFKTFCCSENYQISFAWIMLFCVHCILFICIVYMCLLTAMIGRIYPTFHVKVREMFRINFSLCFAKIHLLNKVFLTADEFALSHYTNFLVTISSC